MDAGVYATLARRWWWLCLLGALFALAAYGVGLRLRGDGDGAAVYSSTATIFIGSEPRSRAVPPDDVPAADKIAGGTADLGRLTASYAQMAGGRLVSERLAAVLQRGPEAESLRTRIIARAIPETQLIHVTSSATTPDEADVLASGAANAFVALHDEKSLPGTAMLYEVSPAVEQQHHARSPFAMAMLVSLVGALSAAAVIGLSERFATPLRSALARGFEAPAERTQPSAAMKTPRRKRVPATKRAPAIDAATAGPEGAP